MTAIIVHGYHLKAPTWKQQVWGTPPNYLGRVPKVIQLLLQNEDTSLIIFGSGGSYNDNTNMFEGEYTYKYLIDNFDTLKLFSMFHHITPQTWNSLRNKIAKISIINRTAKTTQQELVESIKEIKTRKCGKIILVSSQFHVPRCMRDAFIVYPDEFKQNLFAVCSDVVDNSLCPENVVIFEPHHRPDRGKSWTHITKKLFDIPTKHQKSFRQDMNALFASYL